MTLYQQLCNKNLLKRCWESIYNSKPDQRRKSKDITGISLNDFKRKESELLEEIFLLLKSNSYKVDSCKGCIIPKSGKDEYRLLTVPSVRDRIVHKAILSLIVPKVFKYINTGISYCGVRDSIWYKKKNGLSLRNAIQKLIEKVREGNYCVFETDIESFFDSVSKAKLKEKIGKILPDNSLMPLIEQVIHYEIGNRKIFIRKEAKKISPPNIEEGIAQGSHLSPLFSNIFLRDFDEKMKNKYKDKIIRYVDDFIVLGNHEEVTQAAKDAKELLSSEGLNLKQRKTHIFYLSSTIKFLGLRINNKEITTKQGIKAILKKLRLETLNFKNYKEETRFKVLKKDGLEIKIKEKIKIIDQINEEITGWANFYKYYHVNEIFKEVENFFSSLRKKNKYKNLVSLNKIKLEPIISKREWANLFMLH